MTDNKNPHPAKDPQNSEAPEGKNRSQRDESTQAQTIGSEAQHIDTGTMASEHAPNTGTNVTPDDAQDLVDHMKQMERSGTIDRDAFRGERNDDDSESPLGTLGPDEDRDIKLSDE